MFMTLGIKIDRNCMQDRPAILDKAYHLYNREERPLMLQSPLRGPCGAQFEFTLAAIAQNLRRLVKLVARPPPIMPTTTVA